MKNLHSRTVPTVADGILALVLCLVSGIIVGLAIIAMLGCLAAIVFA